MFCLEKKKSILPSAKLCAPRLEEPLNQQAVTNQDTTLARHRLKVTVEDRQLGAVFWSDGLLLEELG